jgi:hypothetical protein
VLSPIRATFPVHLVLFIQGVRARGQSIENLGDFIVNFARYSRKVQDVADLRQRIIEAVQLITPHMLTNTWQELEYRLDTCRATAGAHIEVYGLA